MARAFLIGALGGFDENPSVRQNRRTAVLNCAATPQGQMPRMACVYPSQPINRTLPSNQGFFIGTFEGFDFTLLWKWSEYFHHIANDLV